MRRKRTRLISLPHDVYKIRDTAGRLLYVGCAVNAFTRARQHKAENQPWFPAAATVDIAQYPNMKTARSVEALSIRDESPIWNIAKETRAANRATNATHAPLEEFLGVPMDNIMEVK